MCLCQYLQRKQRVSPGKENEKEASRPRGWLTLGKVKRGNMSKHEKRTFFNRLEISFTFSKSQTTTHSTHGLFFYKRASSKLETQKVVSHRACSSKPWASLHNMRAHYEPSKKNAAFRAKRDTRETREGKNKAPLYFFSSFRLERVTLWAKCRVHLAWLN